jgi:hypothetical protein
MHTLTPRPGEIWAIHKQIVNHVSQYMIPFAFGYGPNPDNYDFNSGSTSLIDLGCGPFALTCEHVVAEFQKFRETHKDKINAQLYIGGATGLDRKIIARDKNLDIATLELNKNELSLIPYNQNLCVTKFIKQIYNGQIKENDVIVVAGFPGAPTWRYKNDINNLFSFHPCVCFAEVVSVNDHHIICQSDLRIYEHEFSHKLTLKDDPAGMSGGPAFIMHRVGNKHICSFIGIISDGKFMERNVLTMYIKLAKRLNSDGTLSTFVE